MLAAVAAVCVDGLAAQAKAQQVTIDVKPGDEVTTIEDRDGMIPVVLLTTSTFDAATADPDSIRIGPKGTEATVFRSMLEDIDRDGDVDRMMLIRVKEMAIKCGDTVIRLTGLTLDGRAIEGSESVTVDGCN